VVVDL